MVAKNKLSADEKMRIIMESLTTNIGMEETVPQVQSTSAHILPVEGEIHTGQQGHTGRNR